MIKVKGNVATFTGKDLKWLKDLSKKYEMTPQVLFTALTWEAVLRWKREEVTKEAVQ